MSWENAWEPHPVHPDMFVTPCGRVFQGRTRSTRHPSPPDEYITEDGRAYRELGSQHIQGYTHCSVKIAPGHFKKRYRHVLVCETVHGPRPHGMEVRHKDGDATNDAKDNLRWGTHTENIYDTMLHGTAKSPKGSDKGNSRHTEEEVFAMRTDWANGMSLTGIMEKYSVVVAQASRLVSGARWPHVPYPVTGKRRHKNWYSVSKGT